MTFAEKLKSARKAAGMSQEVLAEKLGVSRQAVTKWETGRGMPDIENMIVISDLFGVTVDEFLSEEKETAVRRGYLYESRTEYDIDGKKRFDLKLGGARLLRTVGTDSEKVVIRLASDELAGLGSDLKVKIDDIRGRVDVDIHRKNGMTEARAKESLIIEVFLPIRYMTHVELESACDEFHLVNMICENVEFSGKANNVYIDSAEAVLELDCNVDMNICIDRFSGSLEIGQISSTSRLTVPEDFAFRSVLKGFSNSVAYEQNGCPAEDFSDPDADNIVELNGFRSELVIARGEVRN